MGNGLRIILIIFAILWLLLISYFLKKQKLPIKYSIFWYLFVFVIAILGAFPQVLELLGKTFGFITISNLVVGILITMLMFITLLLTIIVSDQKKKIKLLIQEISLLKSEIKNEN